MIFSACDEDAEAKGIHSGVELPCDLAPLVVLQEHFGGEFHLEVELARCLLGVHERHEEIALAVLQDFVFGRVYVGRMHGEAFVRVLSRREERLEVREVSRDLGDGEE